MMSERPYRVNLTELQDLVDEAKRLDSQIEARLGAIEQRVERLHTQWIGAAADGHQQFLDRWTSDTAAMREALATLQTALARAHRNYSGVVDVNKRIWPLTGAISVLPSAFAAAGRLYGQNCDAAASVMRALGTSLDAHSGCGGTDDSGHAWCNKYDPAAFQAVATGTAVVNALGKLNDLLQVDSVNHANADSDSHFTPNAANQLQPPPPTTHFDAPKFKGAYGGDTDAPFGWGLVSRWLQGRVWPNGDSDGLRALSSAWTAAEDGMKGVKSGVAGARRIVDEQISGEVEQILTQIDIVDAAIDNVIAQFDELDHATSDFAIAIDNAHTKIFEEIGEFLAIAGVVEGIGWLAGGPLGGAGGAVVTGACGAATGTRR